MKKIVNEQEDPNVLIQKTEDINFGAASQFKRTSGKSTSCCPAQDRLSSWFKGIGGFAKGLFVLSSILTGGLLYLATLGVFAIKKN